MSQTRGWSAAETAASTAIGYLVALGAQAVVFPPYGLDVAPVEHAGIAATFTAVSLVRGYLVRRLFNGIGAWHDRPTSPMTSPASR